MKQRPHAEAQDAATATKNRRSGPRAVSSPPARAHPDRTRQERRARPEARVETAMLRRSQPSTSPESDALSWEGAVRKGRRQGAARKRDPPRRPDPDPKPVSPGQGDGQRVLDGRPSSCGAPRGPSSCSDARAVQRRLERPLQPGEPAPRCRETSLRAPTVAGRRAKFGFRASALTRLHPEGSGGSRRPGTPESLLGGAAVDHALTPRAGPPEQRPRARATTASRQNGGTRPRCPAPPLPRTVQDSTSPPPRGR
jgi:hypothetical protein